MKAIKVTSSGPLLALVLDDIEGIQTPRSFMVRKGRVTSIPLNFAKSIFNYSGASEMYRTGKLIVTEGEEFLKEEVVKEGFDIPESVNQAEILNILKGTNITRVEELLKGENGRIALQLAADNSELLSQQVIQEIERVTEINIMVEN